MYVNMIFFEDNLCQYSYLDLSKLWLSRSLETSTICPPKILVFSINKHWAVATKIGI